MKVSLLQENLNKAVGLVNRAITGKSQLPILTNILLTTDPGKIKLAGTNLEIGISVWQGAKVEKPGRTTVPAKVFSELIASLPQETVTLELDRDKLAITCGRHRATVNGIAADEFPAIPGLKKGEKKGRLSLKKDLLKGAIEPVTVAAGTDDSRPVFTGVKLEISPAGMRLAATDGYRLSVKTIDDFQSGAVKKSLIVPARALTELARSLESAAGDELVLAPTDEEKQLIFALPDREIVTRLLEGDFPDFDKIIPGSSGTQVEVDAGELRQAVRAAAVFARDSANIVKFRIDSGGLAISANAPQVGENEVGVEARVSGDNGEIAFNARYLLEMLAVVGGGVLTLECSGPLAPGLFRLAGDRTWLHIIMPVRVQA